MVEAFPWRPAVVAESLCVARLRTAGRARTTTSDEGCDLDLEDISQIRSEIRGMAKGSCGLVGSGNALRDLGRDVSREQHFIGLIL